MFSILKKIIPACLVPVVLVSSLPCSAVDLTTNKELVEEFYESMLSKKVLLGEQGSEEALQEYYADQTKSQQQKETLGKIAQVINMFTDDVLGDYYQKWVNDLLELPPGGNSSTYFDNEYTQYAGFYQIDNDGIARSVSVTSGRDSVTVNAHDYTLKITAQIVGADELGAPNSFTDYNTYSSGTWHQGFTFNVSSPSETRGNVIFYRIKDATGLYSAFSGRDTLTYWTVAPNITGNWNASVYYGISSSTTLHNIRSNPTSFPNNSTVGSWGGRVTLPDGTLGERPWEYFNTKFMPWVKGECEDLGFDYKKILPYPNGYNVRDPQEPYPLPTAPNGQPIYNVTYPTEIVTEFVTDDNGEPVTDSNGEPVTEIVYETMTDTNGQPITETELATIPSELYDAEYEFQIPGLPELPTEYTAPEMELPDSSILAGIGGLFQAVGAILESSGLFGILPFVFFTAFLIYLLAKIGG